MANKLVAFRLPEEIVQAIESQATATGSDRTAVVIQALKQVFGFPSSTQTPATVEKLEQRLNEVENQMVSLTEQLAKLSQAKPLDKGAVVLALKLPEEIIENIEPGATATGSDNTLAAVLQALKQMSECLHSEGLPVVAKAVQGLHQVEERS